MEAVINKFLRQPNSELGLLLNGEWGIGKSHFLKDKLIPRLQKEDCNVYYVSLFGIHSSDEIYNQILAQKVLKHKNEKTKKYFTIAGGLVTTALNVFIKNFPGKLKFDKSDIGISFLDFVDVSDSVIIFDDLERIGSSTGVVEILGQISEAFVQNKSVKVIFVANEGKLEDKNFSKIKEKLIGWTVEFNLPISKTNKSIILSYKDNKDYYDYLIRMNEFALNIIDHFNIKNLRSIVFFYDVLEVIYSSVKLYDLDVNKDVFYSTFLLSYEYKNGLFDAKRNINKLPGYITRRRGEDLVVGRSAGDEEGRFNKYIFNDLMKRYSFNFSYFFIDSIFLLITKGEIDEAKITQDINIISEVKKMKQKTEISVLSSSLLRFQGLSNTEYVDTVYRLQQILEEENVNLVDFIRATRTLYYLTRRGNFNIKKEYLKVEIPKILERIDCGDENEIALMNPHLLDREISEILQYDSDLSDLIGKKVGDCRARILEEKYSVLLNNSPVDLPDGYEFRMILLFVSAEKLVSVILQYIENREITILLIKKITDVIKIPIENVPYRRDEKKKYDLIKERLSESRKDYQHVDAYWIDEYLKVFETSLNNLEEE